MPIFRGTNGLLLIVGSLIFLVSQNVYSQCASGFTGAQCESIDMTSPPSVMRVQVLKGNETRVFNLESYDVRANLQVKVVDANGQSTDHAIASSTYQYIGYCEEETGSIVTATLLPNGSLRYHVSTGDGTDDWKYIPTEETSASSVDITYTVLHGTAIAPNGTSYPGASFVTTGRGGLSDDGKQYESHLSFVVPKNYVDAYTNDIDSIVRKAETSVAHMNGHLLRDVLVESRVSQLLIRLDQTLTTSDYNTARNQLSTFGMDNLSNNVFTVLTHSGGGAPACRNGGDPNDSDEQDGSQAWLSGNVDGTWHGILRHEYGHALGSGHFSGNSPEGSTIMSGNAHSKFSGEEIREMEWCYMPKGTVNFKASNNTYTAHDIPPSARLDNNMELDAQGVSTIDVLKNDYDVNGDSIAIQSFDSTTVLGGTVSFVAKASGSRDMLKYVPQSAGNLPDSCGDLCNSTDLLLWLDASDKNTLVDVDDKTGDDLGHLAEIKTWKDKSNNAHHAEIYNSPSKPELHLNGGKTIGGLPTVILENDMMEINNLDLTQHSQITSIAVVQLADGFSEVWVQKQNGYNRRVHHAARGETVKSVAYETNLLTQWTGMSEKDEETISLDPAGVGIALGTGIYPWNGYSGAYHVNMSVAELLIFNRKLSDVERQQVELYLTKKWSLKINDQFNYSIVDNTGRTSQGKVIVPWRYDAATDLSSLDDQVVYIRNRKDCDINALECDWHMSWFGAKSYIVTDTNTYDLVPWRLDLVPGTTNQFYIINEWGGPSAYHYGFNLQFNSDGALDIVNSPAAMPWELFLIPGTVNEYYLRSKYQCEEAHFRCNASISFNNSNRVSLNTPFAKPVPWSIEVINNN